MKRQWRAALILFAACSATPRAHAQTASPTVNLNLPLGLIGTSPRNAADRVLSVMGYSVIPDSNVSAININQGTSSSTNLDIAQLRAGFTIDPSFPLYMEGFIAGSRYDPRFVFSDGQQQRALPARWNNATSTIGLGWDFPITDTISFRPIINGSLGVVASDARLLGFLINHRTDRTLKFLSGGQLSAYGLGGSAMLTYTLAREAYEVNVELRYTDILLQTFGNTSNAVSGSAQSQALGLWSRLRWVLEGTATDYLGPEAGALGFKQLFSTGAGI